MHARLRSLNARPQGTYTKALKVTVTLMPEMPRRRTLIKQPLRQPWRRHSWPSDHPRCAESTELETSVRIQIERNCETESPRANYEGGSESHRDLCEQTSKSRIDRPVAGICTGESKMKQTGADGRRIICWFTVTPKREVSYQMRCDDDLYVM